MLEGWEFEVDEEGKLNDGLAGSEEVVAGATFESDVALVAAGAPKGVAVVVVLDAAV